MLSIFKKELYTYFHNTTGYIVIGIFLLLTGLFLWVIPGEFNVFDAGYANVDGLFFLAPWMFLFLCPGVTMRLFAEEKSTGTWELIITKPISKWGVVAGKFFAAWTMVLMALIPTIFYYFSVAYIAEPAGNVDSGAFWGSFIGLIFLASIYVAIGIFASSLTSNQIVSFIIALVASFFMYYGFEIVGSFFSAGDTIHFFENLGVHAHYQSMSRGVVDSRDIIYFIIVTFVFLFLTERRITRN